MQIYGIFTEYPWKIMENMRKIIPFLSFSFLNLLPDDPFSRSFSVVFGRFRSFLRSFLEKNGEFRRKMENIGEFSGIFTEIIPFHSFSFLNTPILCSTTCF